MLTLGLGSICDICLEAFDSGYKVASTIVCGHVFCSECIDRLRSAPPTTNHPDPNYKPCPLCRHTFDTRTYVRLHVDHDNHNARPTIRVSTGPMVSEEDAQTVHNLLERMINIANEGSSEEEMRQYITEVKTFLQRQNDPKQFIELRTCFRVLLYTFDIRTTNRRLQAQKVELETQVADLEVSLNQVREEKADVELKAKDERNLALTIEKSLQDHAKLTRDGYEAMIMHYNRVATDLSTICEHLQRSYHDDSHSRRQHSTRELASHITQRFTSYHDEHVRRDEHVVSEPGNFTVSPIADYPALPTRPSALLQESEFRTSPPSPRHRSQSPTCCNPDHSAVCDCALLPCPVTPQRPRRNSNSHCHEATATDHLVSESEPVYTDLPDRSAPIPITPTEREADFHSPNDCGGDHQSTKTGRDPKHHNHDHSICGHDQSTWSHDKEITQLSLSSHTASSNSKSQGRRSTSVDKITPLTRTTPLATGSSSYTGSPQMHSSSLHKSASTLRSQRRESIPKEKMPDTTTPPLAPTSESPSTHIFRNHMLHGLLQDTIPTSESPQISTPSPVTQSPIVPPHDSHRSDEKKRSGLGYYTLPQPSPSLLAERLELHRQASQVRGAQNEKISTAVPLRPAHQSYDDTHTPDPTYDPSNVPISSTSKVTKAIAHERAEKVERENKRTEKDKESIRRKADREERRKAKRGEVGYPVSESFALSYKGESSSSSKSRWPLDSYDATQQGASSSRHTSSRDPPPPYTSASQRASASGSKSSRYRDNKCIPVHILSATPA